jgi:hypothetical protein
MFYFKILSWHPPKGTEENRKTLRQDIQSSAWDLNLGPTKYKAKVLTTRP